MWSSVAIDEPLPVSAFSFTSLEAEEELWGQRTFGGWMKGCVLLP